MAFNIHSIYRKIFKIWRKKRFDLFLKVVKPSSSDILLDVGGYPGTWISQPQPVKQIDTLNVHQVEWDSKDFPNHNIRTLVGDGCSLVMPDKSYDIGFSNSVIEHVGSWERQKQFACEIRRVAKVLWVQTPAYECPIEPHYMTFFIHYLPQSFQKKTVRWCSVWGFIEHPTLRQVEDMVDSIRLLTKSEMKQLFPDCEIITERMLWIIPKSYIAIRKRI